MKVIEVEIDKLKGADYNPRGLTEKEKEDLTKSIEEFDLVTPIVVNQAKGRENIIIGGHQRWLIAKETGRKTMPVIYVDIPDIEKEKRLNLRLNKNVGHWDIEALLKIDQEELLDVGFGEEELGDYWDSLLDVEEDGFSVSKALKEIEKPTIKSGEVYKLGKHRLMCGDSTSKEDVKKLMGHKCPCCGENN